MVSRGQGPAPAHQDDEDGLVKQLTEALRQFAAERDWDQYHTPKNLSMALSVEAGELVEIFQWLTSGQSANLSPEQHQHLREEIGDVLLYLLRLADVTGIDPEQAAWEKLEMNAKKYPAHLARGRMDKYTAYEEET